MLYSIVIPAFNESGRIGESLRKILVYSERNNRQVEIIVVDDGSSDATFDVAKEAGENIRLLRNRRNTGKGYSVRRGILSAKGGYILYSDADLSTPIGELDKFLPFLNAGYDIVVGSRALRGSNTLVPQGFLRRNMGRIFNFIIRMVTGLNYRDTQCGFKLFKRDVARCIFKHQKISGFAFDVEVLLKAKRLGYRVKEVPVTWINSPSSRVSMILHPVKMLFSVATLSWFGGDNA